MALGGYVLIHINFANQHICNYSLGGGVMGRLKKRRTQKKESFFLVCRGKPEQLSWIQRKKRHLGCGSPEDGIHLYSEKCVFRVQKKI